MSGHFASLNSSLPNFQGTRNMGISSADSYREIGGQKDYAVLRNLMSIENVWTHSENCS